jgi:hypothetical protein
MLKLDALIHTTKKVCNASLVAGRLIKEKTKGIEIIWGRNLSNKINIGDEFFFFNQPT